MCMRAFYRLFLLTPWLICHLAVAQPYGPPDQDEPGDPMIQQYLEREASKIHQQFLRGVASPDDWLARRGQWEQQYLYMLGLWPLPAKTPLEATVTGTYSGDGFVVEKLHYQSQPRLYVTANLYRPPQIAAGQRLPTVLYVCGHSFRGRDGNKTAYQSHGIWFARHGYVCLVLDTLQLGEIAGIHHGTYREQRWWWHSRGYTSAGVECWNGVRGIDYLISRPDVDAQRIAVTGISGGGASTYWIAAADQRVKAAVPVSGMADLPSYVSNRVINGHCDCMFLYNTFRWPWVRIAGLIAPRPLLFVNSDSDGIFPMDANQRVSRRLEVIYRLFGAGDLVDAVVSMGGHAYRRDIRRAAYRFINMHLKDDPRQVDDSEVDLVTGSGNDRHDPIPPRQLRVFPTDSDIPRDQRNSTIDQYFVPRAAVKLPEAGQYDPWRAELTEELRRVSFGYYPDRIPPATPVGQADESGQVQIETELGIQIPLRHRGTSPAPDPPHRGGEKMGLAPDPVGENAGKTDGTRVPVPIFSPPRRVLLLVNWSAQQADLPKWIDSIRQAGDDLFELWPRGIGPTRWTRRNPPNYVERSHVLIGRTVDAGRVWDVIAAARYLRNRYENAVEVHVVGEGAAGLIAAYAALWETDIAGVVARKPPMTHMDSSAPQLLNVLRVCDAPHVLGMLAPRPLTVCDGSDDQLANVAAIYAAAGSPDRFQTKSILDLSPRNPDADP